MATKTWAGGTTLFSTGTWSPAGTPTTGDNLIFDGTSSTSCTLDTALTFGTVSLNTGYGGTVTQGSVDIGSSDVTVSAGTLTGSSSQYWNCSGSFLNNGTGAITNTLRLVMQTDGKTISFKDTSQNPIYLRISGNTTINSNMDLKGPSTLIIDSGKTLTIATSCTFFQRYYSGSVFTNSGSILGPGYIGFRLYDADMSITFGTISASVQMDLHSASAASHTLSLGANATLGSTLSIASSHASNTLTLSHGTNYTLSVTGLTTLGTRGIMTQGTGTWAFTGGYTQSGASSVFTQGGNVTSGDVSISSGTTTGSASYTWTCSGAFSDTGGTFTSDVFKLIMTGASKVMTNNNGNITFNSLQISNNISTVGSGAWRVRTGTFTIDTNCTLSLGIGTTFQQMYGYGAGNALSNSGIIGGLGTFKISIRDDTPSTIAFGTINAPVLMNGAADMGGSRTLTLLASPTFGSTFTLQSDHASNTMTLDLSASGNYPLTAYGAITVGTRGILLGRGSLIKCFESFDPHAGTWTPGTSQLVMTGTGTITLAANQTIYDLIDRGVITLGANATVSNMYAHVGAMKKGAYTLTLTNPTQEYTGLRRPLRRKLSKTFIPNRGARALLEHLERSI